MKKHIILFSLIMGTIGTAWSQYGINATYQTFGAKDWEQIINDANTDEASAISSGFGVGIDRWFRLKNQRVEFFPELNYSTYSKSWDNNFGAIKDNQISLYANTSFYLFDMAGDCDCPTFSKDGGIFKKGFFVQISPGISYSRLNVQRTDLEIDQTSSTFNPSLGIGAGVDIGLNDFVTITPFLKYRYLFGAEWEDLQSTLRPEVSVLLDTNTGIETVSFGVRVGVRFDER